MSLNSGRSARLLAEDVTVQIHDAGLGRARLLKHQQTGEEYRARLEVVAIDQQHRDRHRRERGRGQSGEETTLALIAGYLQGWLRAVLNLPIQASGNFRRVGDRSIYLYILARGLAPGPVANLSSPPRAPAPLNWNPSLQSLFEIAHSILTQAVTSELSRERGLQLLSHLEFASDMGSQLMDAMRLSDRTPRTAPIDATQVVSRATGFMEARIPTSVTMVREIPEEAHFVQADSALLSLVVVHLLSDAIQATESQGRVGIALEQREELLPTPRFIVRPTTPGPHLCMTVWNDGPGIEEGREKQLFHDKQGLHGPTNQTDLSVVRRMVEEMAGCVAVRSVLDVQTCIQVFVPSAPRALDESSP